MFHNTEHPSFQWHDLVNTGYVVHTYNIVQYWGCVNAVWCAIRISTTCTALQLCVSWAWSVTQSSTVH